MKRLVTLLQASLEIWLSMHCVHLRRRWAMKGLSSPLMRTLMFRRHFMNPDILRMMKNTLDTYGLQCQAISAHLTGQCVCDVWDERLDGFAPPSHLAGNPEGIRSWAIEEMKDTARAAKALGVSVVNGFTGSPIWARWYSYPQTSNEMIEKGGYEKVYDLWTPIFDVFDECGVRFALEVHPTEIAFDWYTTERLFELFGWRETLGLNFDPPSHLLWQGVDEVGFVRDFAKRIYHVHMKDVKINHRNPRGGGFLVPFFPLETPEEAGISCQ